MTNWMPTLTSGSGPLYSRIADQIEGAIVEGELPAGAKLPPQRNLAYDLGVTIGTIGRAYSLIRERGLVSGEVGRGTYVLDRSETAPDAAGLDPVSVSLTGTRPVNAPLGKTRFDSTSAPDVGQGLVLGQLFSDISQDHPSEVASYTRNFPQHWFDAGRQWLSRGDWSPRAENIVATLGAHAGVMAVISAATAPGDKIAFENLTYSQISRSAALIGRRNALVESDEHGMLPEDFERVCAQQHPKMAFLMPTAQNPTVVTLSLERRKAIVAIARAHSVWLIEDNLYGSMTSEDLPLLAELAPERTFLVGGLSKSVAAGVRGGWVACPPHYSQRVRIAHKMVTGGIPFVLAELCSRLVLSGQAAEIRKKCVAEINARQQLARDILSGLDFNTHPNIPFLWLKLPEPWLSGTFRNAALDEGVLVDDEDEFKAGRPDKVFHRARIGLSAPPARDDVRLGLLKLRRLLDNGRSSYDSYA
ncbi:aminotransferase-like domain-containing protein [Pararhizobium sp.]|uniref:aminotransferase-like domain-containing protein n=1 Tax=Pararhizobium sp. TaxID=1977563 RepID=UPI002720E452|nr:PLP-dependent aminotransferase family protein [Pararhizobium sp.]MDO9417118.1 PLP-dependent aminotransferase family protein [Pararhizobium sp.]